MSTSIVLWAGAAGVWGVHTVLVMAWALGLGSAAALTLWAAAEHPHPAASATTTNNNAVPGKPRSATAALARLWTRWPRPTPMGADPAGAPTSLGDAAGRDQVAVVGYATFGGAAGKDPDEDLARQAEIIARACEQRGLRLLEMVGDPHEHRRLFRPRRLDPAPGLDYSLRRIAAGEAQGLVVPGLRRLANSAAELGPIVEWFIRRRARLVAVAQGFDIGEPDGYVAARLIVEVSRWERERLWEPSHEGQSPSSSVTASLSGNDDAGAIDSSEGGAS